MEIVYFITYRYFKSAFFSPDELRLNLNIKNFNNLKAKRNKAMKDGILIRSENDEVKVL